MVLRYLYSLILASLFLLSSCNFSHEQYINYLNYAPFDSGNIKYKLKGNSPSINFHISSGFSSSEVQAIKDSAYEWENASFGTVRFDFLSTDNQGYDSLNLYNEDKIFGIYKKTKWFKDYPKSALALTVFKGVVRYQGSIHEYFEIQEADIIVNWSHPFTTDINDHNAYDLQSVLIHEIGHVLGLVHSHEDDSVMIKTLNLGEKKRIVSYLDIETLLDLYILKENDTTNIRSYKQLNSDKKVITGIIEIHAK